MHGAMKRVISVLLMLFMAANVHASPKSRLSYVDAYNECPACNSVPCGCSAGECYPSRPMYVCPPCPPTCDPCAPVCGTDCGLTICAIGVAVLAVIAAAIIVATSGEHNPNAH